LTLKLVHHWKSCIQESERQGCQPAPARRTGITGHGLPQTHGLHAALRPNPLRGRQTKSAAVEPMQGRLSKDRNAQCAARTDALLQLWLNRSAGGRPTPARDVGEASAVRPTPAGAGITVGSLHRLQAASRWCDRTGFVLRSRKEHWLEAKAGVSVLSLMLAASNGQPATRYACTWAELWPRDRPAGANTGLSALIDSSKQKLANPSLIKRWGFARGVQRGRLGSLIKPEFQYSLSRKSTFTSVLDPSHQPSRATCLIAC